MYPAILIGIMLVLCMCAAATGADGAISPPPGEAGAREALNTSPRHGEWADVQVSGRDKPIRTYVVYPERSDKAPVVIVIHEIFGLTDWVRSVADRLAADGFIAIAPDLLSGMGPGGGGTEVFADRDSVTAAVRSLDPAKVDPALNAVMAYGLKLPAASGSVAVVGYCWGGAQSFRYATVQPELDAAVVYYGPSPDASAMGAIKAPVLGLYGGDDARVNATIEPAKKAMGELGKTYEVQIFEGAGHGFLRAQDGREANKRAAEQAWPQTIAFLRKHTAATQ
jgi:carboxymethylenebutenolidase